MTDAPIFPPLSGWLNTNDRSYRVQVRYASRFTLWAVFEESPGRIEVENLDVRVGDRVICFGPCRILSDWDSEDRVVWLIPTLNIHDLELIFSREEVRILPLGLSGLPLSEDYRQGIDPAFIAFLSEMMYGMNAFMIQLDKLDSEYKDELPLVQAAIQSSMIAQAAPTFNDVLEGWNKRLLEFIIAASPVERDHYGRFFRRQIWSILLRAPIFAQSNLRSLYSPEDPKVRQMILRNNHEGTSTFGKLLHKFAVSLPVAQAARNVRDDCTNRLQDRLQLIDPSDGNRCRVLALSNSASLEWLEGLLPPAFEHLILTLHDSDPEVLADAATQIRKLETVRGVALQVNYLLASLGSLAETNPVPIPEHVFDFIFALGLLDSQIDAKARAVIRTLYEWLSPGGEILLTNVATDNPNQILAEYWNDIRMHDRSEKQCLDLVSNLGDSDSALSYDATRMEMMLRVTRPRRPARQEAFCEL